MIPIWYFNHDNYFTVEKNTSEIKTLSCLTSKIWGFEFELRPSKVNSGQNYFCCSKTHIIISYSIFDFNVFRFWPLTSKSYLGLKEYTIRKPIYDFLFDFYGHHLSILYRFRVIRLQKFQGSTLTFDVWKSSGVEKIILFEGPYMTSYLTSMDTMDLSISYRYRYIRLQIVEGLTLTFGLWEPSGVMKIYIIRKIIYDFLFDLYR